MSDYWPEGYLEAEREFCKEVNAEWNEVAGNPDSLERERVRNKSLARRQEFARNWMLEHGHV